MDTILIALAFVGGLIGLIIVGMMITMYFYSHDALWHSHLKGTNSLGALTVRSVPIQVITDAGQSEVNLGLTLGPGDRYARGSMMVMAMVLLLTIIAFVSVLSSSMH
jgi:hypothetical protein